MSDRPEHPPTMFERAQAAHGRRALLAAWGDPLAWGEPQVLHIDLSRPRRGVWITRWANLPGLCNVNGRYQHDSLPGWEYTREEVTTEMIPDLEALALRGERPTKVTTPSKDAAYARKSLKPSTRTNPRGRRRHALRNGTPDIPGLLEGAE